MVAVGQAPADLFKDVVDVISDLSVDAVFNFYCTGFEIQAMDTSGVAVVAFFLHAEDFISYKCDSDFALRLDLAYMAEFISSAANNSNLTIRADVHFVEITVDLPQEVEVETYIEGDKADIFEIPRLETMYTARVRMRSEQFKLICELLNILADSGDIGALIKVRKDYLSFLFEGINLYSATSYTNTRTVDNVESEQAVNIEMEEEVVSQTFALRYLNSVSKLSTLSDHVTISLSRGLPAVFEYKIREKGYVKYFMYPKI